MAEERFKRLDALLEAGLERVSLAFTDPELVAKYLGAAELRQGYRGP